MGDRTDRTGVETRTCLQCGAPFASTGPGNRFCEACVRSAAAARARPFVETSEQKRRREAREFAEIFDIDIVRRAKRAKAFDDARRKTRQEAIRRRKEAERKEAGNMPVTEAQKTLKRQQLGSYTRAGLREHASEICEALSEYVGETWTGPIRRALAAEIARILRVPVGGVWETLSVRDAPDGYPALRDEARFLAGNRHVFRRDEPALRWRKGGALEEWCMLEIRECLQDAYVSKTTGRTGYRMQVRVLTGSLATRDLPRDILYGTEPRIGRALGVPAKEAGALQHWELAGMCGFAHFGLRTSPDLPVFTEIHATPTQKKENRDLYEGRLRDCPKGYRPGQYTTCAECPLGYEMSATGDERCRYAVRPHRQGE